MTSQVFSIITHFLNHKPVQSKINVVLMSYLDILKLSKISYFRYTYINNKCIFCSLGQNIKNGIDFIQKFKLKLHEQKSEYLTLKSIGKLAQIS